METLEVVVRLLTIKLVVVLVGLIGDEEIEVNVVVLIVGMTVNETLLLVAPDVVSLA